MKSLTQHIIERLIISKTNKDFPDINEFLDIVYELYTKNENAIDLRKTNTYKTINIHPSRYISKDNIARYPITYIWCMKPSKQERILAYQVLIDGVDIDLFEFDFDEDNIDDFFEILGDGDKNAGKEFYISLFDELNEQL